MEVRETPVTVIVTGRNSATTIRPCLESLAQQDWPIDEILVFDNGSTDGTPQIVFDVMKSAKAPIRLIDGGKDGFICSAYNRGAAMAKSEILVLCHSDGQAASPHELRRLVAPLAADPSAAAAYPRLLMPRAIWDRFPFWQKFLFVRSVDSTAHSKCAIFDAVRRDVYLRAGGFDEERFFAGCGIGGEDNDAQVRFSRFGKQLLTEARVLHLHSFSPNYGIRNYLLFRALLERTYAKQLRWQRGVVNASDLLFLVRPALALLPFAALAGFAVSRAFGWCALAFALALQVAFAAVVSRKMFVARSTWRDARIALVLPLAVFMIYYEAFWFFHGLVTPFRHKARTENAGGT